MNVHPWQRLQVKHESTPMTVLTSYTWKYTHDSAHKLTMKVHPWQRSQSQVTHESTPMTALKSYTWKYTHDSAHKLDIKVHPRQRSQVTHKSTPMTALKSYIWKYTHDSAHKLHMKVHTWQHSQVTHESTHMTALTSYTWYIYITLLSLFVSHTIWKYDKEGSSTVSLNYTTIEGRESNIDFLTVMFYNFSACVNMRQLSYLDLWTMETDWS